ncbi:MAG TPA: hypothetical protein VH143_22850 [Kofleriaceae bacterium]|jgi:hypothetical protein|nr:hypothetical protein [Kofleriaceae bacterium]
MRKRLLAIATYVFGCGSTPMTTPGDAATSDAARAIDAMVDAAVVDRQLGLEIEAPGSATQGEAINLAKPFGVDAIPLTIPWSTIEPGGSGFDMSIVTLLDSGMTFYRSQGLHVILSIPAIDTVANLVPSDLAGDALDSTAVTTRAQAMVAEVLAHCGSELEYLVLSNEVDINLADGSPTWAQLDALTAAELAKVKALRPDVQSGISVTSNALVSSPPNGAAIAALEANDIAFVTYYNAGNFGTASTAGVAADMAAIVAVVSKPIVFKEFGYATGSAVGGSDAGQVAFVTDAFTAWDANAARVPLVVYSRMYDGSAATCASEAKSYGEGSNAAFVQFLCTLGLRTYGDQAKPAWTTFTQAASARAFH